MNEENDPHLGLEGREHKTFGHLSQARTHFAIPDSYDLLSEEQKTNRKNNILPNVFQLSSLIDDAFLWKCIRPKRSLMVDEISGLRHVIPNLKEVPG